MKWNVKSKIGITAAANVNWRLTAIGLWFYIEAAMRWATALWRTIVNQLYSGVLSCRTTQCLGSNRWKIDSKRTSTSSTRWWISSVGGRKPASSARISPASVRSSWSCASAIRMWWPPPSRASNWPSKSASISSRNIAGTARLSSAKTAIPTAAFSLKKVRHSLTILIGLFHSINHSFPFDNNFHLTFE